MQLQTQQLWIPIEYAQNVQDAWQYLSGLHRFGIITSAEAKEAAAEVLTIMQSEDWTPPTMPEKQEEE